MRVFPILKGMRPALHGSTHGNPNQCGQGNRFCSLSSLPSPSMDTGAAGGVGSLSMAWRMKGHVIGWKEGP